MKTYRLPHAVLLDILSAVTPAALSVTDHFKMHHL